MIDRLYLKYIHEMVASEINKIFYLFLQVKAGRDGEIASLSLECDLTCWLAKLPSMPSGVFAVGYALAGGGIDDRDR